MDLAGKPGWSSSMRCRGIRNTARIANIAHCGYVLGCGLTATGRDVSRNALDGVPRIDPWSGPCRRRFLRKASVPVQPCARYGRALPWNWDPVGRGLVR